MLTVADGRVVSTLVLALAWFFMYYNKQSLFNCLGECCMLFCCAAQELYCGLKTLHYPLGAVGTFFFICELFL